MIKTFYPERCKTCNIQFQPVDWLKWRVDGYCCEKHVPEEKEPVVLENDACELF
jgi:hypothetical protein